MVPIVGMVMVGNAGTCGTGMLNFVVVGDSGTLPLDLLVGVCTTVQESLVTVTIGSIFAPGA